jgi:hypothetical protein
LVKDYPIVLRLIDPKRNQISSFEISYFRGVNEMNTNQGISRIVSPIMKIASFILRALAVILIGLVSAVIGFIVGATIFGILGLGLFGAEGYEAGGPIGFILCALVGLIGSGLALFRRRNPTTSQN